MMAFSPGVKIGIHFNRLAWLAQSVIVQKKFCSKPGVCQFNFSGKSSGRSTRQWEVEVSRNYTFANVQSWVAPYPFGGFPNFADVKAKVVYWFSVVYNRRKPTNSCFGTSSTVKPNPDSGLRNCQTRQPALTTCDKCHFITDRNQANLTCSFPITFKISF